MRSLARVGLALLVVLLMAPLARAGDGLALTPPMGWNSWNKFGCNVSEKLIRDAADALVSSGMKDTGYEYVVIDDCWQVRRDAAGKIVADPERFPSGIKALADAIHAGLSDAQQPGFPATAQRGLETRATVEQFCFPQLFPPRPDELDRWREVLEIDDALAPAQPALRLLADGLAEDRARWLRLYGNGVVPLQAAYAFISLWSALREQAATP